MVWFLLTLLYGAVAMEGVGDREINFSEGVNVINVDLSKPKGQTQPLPLQAAVFNIIDKHGRPWSNRLHIRMTKTEVESKPFGDVLDNRCDYFLHVEYDFRYVLFANIRARIEQGLTIDETVEGLNFRPGDNVDTSLLSMTFFENGHSMLSSLSSFKMTSTEMRSIFGITAMDILQAGLHIAFEVFNVKSVRTIDAAAALCRVRSGHIAKLNMRRLYAISGKNKLSWYQQFNFKPSNGYDQNSYQSSVIDKIKHSIDNTGLFYTWLGYHSYPGAVCEGYCTLPMMTIESCFSELHERIVQETSENGGLFMGCRACECQYALANSFESIVGGTIERFWNRQDVGACSANSLCLDKEGWSGLNFGGSTLLARERELFDPPVTVPSIEQFKFPYNGMFVMPYLEIDFHHGYHEDGSPYAKFRFEVLPSLLPERGKVDMQLLVLRSLEEGTARRGG